MKTSRLLVLIAMALALLSCKTEEKEKYTADWASLAQHEETPEWFTDAKIGIYFHWGVYTVPAYGNEWYPRFMHCDWRDEYKHHCETYGKPEEFGYHDFVPMFKAEHFNAKEWVTLFKESGAKFVGPVAEHHDGFSMWDSEITPWNAMDKGPKRDIVGEIAKEVKAQDLKLITTFHHARNLQKHDTIRAGSRKEPYHQSHFPYFEGMAPTSDDAELKYLYGNLPKEQWYKEVWLGKLEEVIDAYEPDIIWFDSWLEKIPESYRQEFAAYYLNKAKKWGKDVMMVTKHAEIPDSVGINDLEKSRKQYIEEKVWMTDETISRGSWSYTDGMELKTTSEIIHILADVVSKNGVMLFNVSPKSDGNIPNDQREVLKGMGKWLKVNGEAIYGTRPWVTYGEGPTAQPVGSFENAHAFDKVKYSAMDFRYTQKDGNVYAIELGAPSCDELCMTAFAGMTVKNVTLIGRTSSLKWKVDAEGLKINVKGLDLDVNASAFKIEL